MSLPLTYQFFEATRKEEGEGYNLEHITGCYSDGCYSFGIIPSKKDELCGEALSAFAKLARFVKKGELTADEALKVNLVFIEGEPVGDDDLKDYIAEGKVVGKEEELAAVAEIFPDLIPEG